MEVVSLALFPDHIKEDKEEKLMHFECRIKVVVVVYEQWMLASSSHASDEVVAN